MHVLQIPYYRSTYVIFSMDCASAFAHHGNFSHFYELIFCDRNHVVQCLILFFQLYCSSCQNLAFMVCFFPDDPQHTMILRFFFDDQMNCL